MSPKLFSIQVAFLTEVDFSLCIVIYEGSFSSIDVLCTMSLCLLGIFDLSQQRLKFERPTLSHLVNRFTPIARGKSITLHFVPCSEHLAFLPNQLPIQSLSVSTTIEIRESDNYDFSPISKFKTRPPWPPVNPIVLGFYKYDVVL